MPDCSKETNTTTTNNTMDTKSAEEIGKLLPIRMTSCVVQGFGRGSKDLGIPTANLDLSRLHMHHVSSDGKETKVLSSLQDIPCGIYWGYCRVGEKMTEEGLSNMNGTTGTGTGTSKSTICPLGVVYTTAVSIGYNPTYGNDHKTVEPHLIAPESDPRRHASSSGETILQDFYEQPVRLSIVGYLRPELPFEGLDKLVVAIKKDIGNAVRLGQSSTDDAKNAEESSWVQSSEKLLLDDDSP